MTKNAQLIDKLIYCYYMSRHYCIILRELLVSTLLSYTNVSMQLLVTKLNSVALVRERTIPTERPPPVGEVSANFCG